MTRQPLVSVVTIFLNAETFIQEAIDSVLTQAYDRWELVLVDDGSTDGSTAIGKANADKHPDRIRYFEHARHANLGMSASRNAGVREARGEYIAFLDSDDVWLPHKLERQVSILEAEPRACMVYGATQYWHGWTKRPEDIAKDYVPALGVDADVLIEPPTLTTQLYPLGTGTSPCPSDLMVRRAAFEMTGGFEESFTGMYGMYEDQAFLSKVYLKCPVFVSSECWDRYRIHPGSCMAAVAREGQYHAVRQFFLHWFRVFLQREDVKDAAVWNALRRALEVQGSDRQSRRQRRWTLRAEGGSSAELVFPASDPEVVRVEIGRIGSGASYDVQLNQPRLRVEGQRAYSVQFRAKADGPRTLDAGFAEAHGPWQGLGWHRRFELTAEWQGFEGHFVALKDDANARIHFDLGDSPISVEFSGVSLRTVDDGQVVEPGVRDAQPSEYLGALRRLTPISREWGFDRGTPVDRYFIERFLSREAGAIQGRVLEIEDDMYTMRFGGDRVSRSDILHVAEGNPKATIVGDLTCADHISSGAFDCIVLTQTLQLIYDAPAALRTLYRILKPGGVLLATFPGLSRVSQEEWAGSWFWGFTTASARRLFTEAFPLGTIDVRAVGNVLTTIAFLHGLAAEDLDQYELDFHDPDYELLLTVRAVKAPAPA